MSLACWPSGVKLPLGQGRCADLTNQFLGRFTLGSSNRSQAKSLRALETPRQCRPHLISAPQRRRHSICCSQSSEINTLSPSQSIVIASGDKEVRLLLFLCVKSPPRAQLWVAEGAL